LMRDTGGIIVGDVARAFFTGERPPKELELLFVNVDITRCLQSWASFLGIDTDIQKISYTRLLERYRFPQNSEVSRNPLPQITTAKGNDNKRILPCVYKYKLIGTSGRLSFLQLAFFEEASIGTQEVSLFPQNRVAVSVHGSRQCNYISWNTAFCPRPWSVSKWKTDDGYGESLTCYGQCRKPSSLIHDCRPWTVGLPLPLQSIA
jgi:hypothetical protein